MDEKIYDFASKHPTAYLAICYGVGIVVSIPLAILSYKCLGKIAGKAAAKELAKLS